MSQQPITISNPAPNYKLEVGDHMQHLLLIGIASGLVGIALLIALSGALRLIAVVLIGVGVLAVLFQLLLLAVTNNRARLNARRKMMNSIAWRGDEMILDVGCGNGFLMLEAAKHLTSGKATGIDIWVEDSGGQTGSAVWQNAALEGVKDKVDVQNVDARQMPYASATFDVIMSSLALHHMGSNADRDRALQEMMRVLKPGGTILLYDMFPMVNQAENVMRPRGFGHIQPMGGILLRRISEIPETPVP